MASIHQNSSRADRCGAAIRDALKHAGSKGLTVGELAERLEHYRVETIRSAIRAMCDRTGGVVSSGTQPARYRLYVKPSRAVTGGRYLPPRRPLSRPDIGEHWRLAELTRG